MTIEYLSRRIVCGLCGEVATRTLKESNGESYRVIGYLCDKCATEYLENNPDTQEVEY